MSHEVTVPNPFHISLYRSVQHLSWEQDSRDKLVALARELANEHYEAEGYTDGLHEKIVDKRIVVHHAASPKEFRELHMVFEYVPTAYIEEYETDDSFHAYSFEREPAKNDSEVDKRIL
jgi:capsid protein